MWDGASALFLAAQNGHSRFAPLMMILAIGKPADKMMITALKKMDRHYSFENEKSVKVSPLGL